MSTGNKWVWVKYLSFCEFALNITVVALTCKTPFELVYGGIVIVPLDHLTGSTQLSHLQTAREMSEAVLWLVNMAKTELGIA